MPTPPLSDRAAQEALNAEANHDDTLSAADALGIPRATLQHRVRIARSRGMAPDLDADTTPESEIRQLRERCKSLENKVRQVDREEQAVAYIKSQFHDFHQSDPTPPRWILKKPKATKKNLTSIPALMLSDLHWGEIIDSNQVEGCNAYDLEIAHARMKRTLETGVDLLQNHIAHENYPGIVLLLGGDMVSGDIHAELRETNELSSMQTVLDLQGVLIKAIEWLAEQFGQVWVIGVDGNHGRTTDKPRAKNRVYLSYDWLLYQELAMYFERDKRVDWYIPDSGDATFTLFGTTFRMTHGDGFKGGDGMIGPLGPVARGDHKKRTFANQIGKPYDVLIHGHFHISIMMPRFMGCGSMAGYNEYAYSRSLPWEPPSQLLFTVHPTHGITFPMRIYCDEPESTPSAEPFTA